MRKVFYGPKKGEKELQTGWSVKARCRAGSLNGITIHLMIRELIGRAEDQYKKSGTYCQFACLGVLIEKFQDPQTMNMVLIRRSKASAEDPPVVLYVEGLLCEGRKINTG